MKATCMLTIECRDAERAKNILRSITIDDQGFVHSKRKGKTIEATVEATSVASLLHTLYDYLACVSVAEKIVNKS
jgi:tRNA threonylcarbamoyladenosine modification (KEOPS) complex  Pcc1 subunit